MHIHDHLIRNLQILPFRNIKEEVTLSKIIDPIIEISGFETMDIDSVEEEFNANLDESAFPIEIDRCLKNKGNLMAFIQCKQLGSKSRLKSDNKKTIAAALLKNIPWIIFTDGEYWAFYKLENSSYEFYKEFNLRFDFNRYNNVVDLLKKIKIEKYEN